MWTPGTAPRQRPMEILILQRPIRTSRVSLKLMVASLVQRQAPLPDTLNMHENRGSHNRESRFSCFFVSARLARNGLSHTVGRDLEVVRVDLDPDVAAAGLDGGHADRAGTHERVENQGAGRGDRQ